MQGFRRVLGPLSIALVLSTAQLAHAQRRADPGTPVPPPATQAEQADTLDEAARLLFQSARAAFDAGDYPTALARFRQAYAASPRPALLFNIATTLDRLRQDDEACATFERYLAAAPGVANRLEIEARIRSLRAANDARDHAANDAATVHARAETAPHEMSQPEADPSVARGAVVDRGGTSPALFFVSGGLAVASGALAVWAGLTTISLNDDYEAYAASPGATQGPAKLLYDDATSRQLLTNVFIVGAAVFGAATIALAVLTDWGGPDGDEAAARATTTPVFSLDAHGGLAGLVHRF